MAQAKRATHGEPGRDGRAGRDAPDAPDVHDARDAPDVELSDEVVRWYVRLNARDRAFADRALDRLVATGSRLRMPHNRAIGSGLHELRFTCEGVSRRITYAFGEGREVALLTTFRKQRERERHEVDRAHQALARMKSRGRETERGTERNR